MTIATFLSRRRRVLLLCAASVMLHWVMIGWVGEHIGPLQNHPPKLTLAMITAQLHLAPSAPPLASSASTALQAVKAPPKPAFKPAVKRRARPEAELEAAEPAPAGSGEHQGTDLAAPVGPEQASVEGGAAATADAASSPQPVDEAGAAEQAGAAPEEPASPPQRRFKVDLPPSAELTLEVLRVDPDGAVWNGVAAMSWQQNAGSYKLTVEAGISMIVTRLNLLLLASDGAIDEAGIAPVTATEKRKGRAQTATHFNRIEGRITFSASERSFPLLPGTQDKATLPLQLAGIGRADAKQLAGDIDIMVGEDKEANMFHFVVLGQEEIETKLGKLLTWHLSRPPRPGAYNSKLDVWLAPERDWYPVQIRNTESNGAVTTQTVSKIAMTETGK